MDDSTPITVKIRYDGIKFKSIVWKYFGDAFRGGEIIDKNYSYCKLCMDDGIHKRYKETSSTSSMKAHLMTDHHIDLTTLDSAEARLSNVPTTAIQLLSEQERKTQLSRRILMMLAKDLLPFEFVNGVGFRDFAIEEGIVQEISEIPSDRNLANSALSDVFLFCEAAVKKKLLKAPKVISVEVDMSTSICGAIPLVTTVISFMVHENLSSHTLGTEKFEKPHTHDRIAELVNNKMEHFNLDDRLLLVTTDQGPNVVASFRKIKNGVVHFKCKGHEIHSVLTKDILKASDYNVVENVLKKVKKAHGSLVYQLYKLKEIHQRLNHKEILECLDNFEATLEAFQADEETPYFYDEVQMLTQEYYQQLMEQEEPFTAFSKPVVTRWFSTRKLCLTYRKNQAAINQLLVETKNTDLCLNGNEEEILNELISFYDIFQTALVILQTGKEPTSHMILLLHDNIMKKLDSLALSAKFIPETVKLAQTSFEKRFEIKIEYIGAAILDPCQVNLQLIDKHVKRINKSHDEVLRELYLKFKLHENQSTDVVEAHSLDLKEYETPTKKARSQLIDEHSSNNNEAMQNDWLGNLNDQISRYIISRKFDHKKVGISSFWASQQFQLPDLFKLSQVLFSIAPMSVRAERAFSFQNALMSKKRASMRDERAFRLTFIHDNYEDLKNELKKFSSEKS